MAATPNPPNGADSDLRRLLAALWHDRWVIGLGALGLASVVAIWLSQLTPQYRADARVLIGTSEPVVTGPVAHPTIENMRLDEQAIAGQLAILGSSEFLLGVADALDLASRAEFGTTLSSMVFDIARARLGVGPPTTMTAGERRVLGKIRQRLRVFSIDAPPVIVIEFRSIDPALAAKVVNMIARSYVEFENQARSPTAGTAAHDPTFEAAALRTGGMTAVPHTLAATSFNGDDNRLALPALARPAAEGTGNGRSGARILSTATEPLPSSLLPIGPAVAASFLAGLTLMITVTLWRVFAAGRRPVPVAARKLRPHVAPDEDVRVGARRPDTVRAPGMHDPGLPLPQRPVDPLCETPAVEDTAGQDDFSPAAVSGQLIRRGTGRVLVVSCGGHASADGAVDLVRRMSNSGLRAILVDLSGTGIAGARMLQDRALTGIADLLAAKAALAEIIHGDIASNAHIVPCGGIDARLAAGAVDHLATMLGSLSEAYDVVVVACGLTDVAELDGLVSRDSDIVLAIDAQSGPAASGIATDLVRAGHHDVLVVLPRGHDADPLDGRHGPRVSEPA